MKFKNRIYTGPIKSIIEKSGFRPILASFYATLNYHYNNTPTVEVGGKEVKFKTDNLPEYKRVIYLSGEKEVLADIISEMKSNDIVWDVGANIGVYTCVLGVHLPKGQIIAFEPHPNNIERLNENVALNGIDCTIHNLALSNSDEKVQFSLEGDITGEGHGHIVPSISTADNTISVKSVRGDRMDENSPNIIKIDVEGAEADALKGMSDILRKESCRLVYCEVHLNHLPNYGSSSEDVSEILKEAGFDIEILYEFGDGDSYCIKAKKS